MRLIVAAGILLFCTFTPVQAQDVDELLQNFDTPSDNATSGELDSVMEGFGSGESVSVENSSGERSDFDFTTSISLYSSYAHSAERGRQGLAALRGEFQEDVEYKPSMNLEFFVSVKYSRDLVFGIRGDDGYTHNEVDDRAEELELRSAYILATPFSALDLKIGRQVVVWGKSDNIRITDVLNPMDKREPGLTDIEDLRLPVFMTKADYYFGDWNLALIAVHENRLDKLPPYGSDYYPAPYEIDDVKPADGGSETEYAAALNGIFSGWDLSLYAAKIHDDTGYIRMGERLHDFTEMLGFSVNIAEGNWLLKGEGAYFSRLRYTGSEDEKPRGDILLGGEYSGFEDMTVSLELADRHTFDHEERIERLSGSREDELETVLRVTKNMYNERLELTYLAYAYREWGSGGYLQRIEAEWEQTDRLTLRGGLGLYNGGSRDMMESIRKSDRVYTEAKYVF